jgi:hypothetical protein
MRAVGVVEATCEAIFGLIMSMDVTRYEYVWFYNILFSLPLMLISLSSLCIVGGTVASVMVV